MTRTRLVALATSAALLLVFATAARAAPAEGPLRAGDRLPALRGELLDGRRWVVPDSTAGRATLLLLGFSYASRHDVGAWTDRFLREFGSRAGLTYFEVPVIGTAGRLGRPFIDGSMRRGLPAARHAHVLMVYRDAGTWKRRAAVVDAGVGHLLLVGPDGRVRWRGHGPLTDGAWEALAGAIRGLGP